MVVILGEKDNGFVIDVADISTLSTIRVVRNANQQLVANIIVTLRGDVTRTFSWVLKDPEYTDEPSTLFFGLYKTTKKVLVKYYEKDFKDTEGYRNAIANFDSIFEAKNKG